MTKKRKIDKSPVASEGARYERSAFRAMLRRRLKVLKEQRGPLSGNGAYEGVNAALIWVLKRQERYDKKAGGL